MATIISLPGPQKSVSRLDLWRYMLLTMSSYRNVYYHKREHEVLHR